jgi:hypothetical protein
VHAYIDVTDKGENLVSKLGLQTVPTHVLVDKSGQVRTASEPPPPSTHSNTSTPMTLPHTESGDAPWRALPIPSLWYDTWMAKKNCPHGLLQLVSVLARKQLPDGPTVEALVTNADGGSA